VPHNVHIALYRIAQEALSNVVKHTRAKQVTIDLRFVPLAFAAEQPSSPLNGIDGLRVELGIREDARGFDLKAIPPERLGLDLMRERAESVGAQFKVESAAGCGTSLMVTWKNGQGGTDQ